MQSRIMRTCGFITSKYEYKNNFQEKKNKTKKLLFGIMSFFFLLLITTWNLTGDNNNNWQSVFVFNLEE